jgi:hypothetical protein
MNKAISWKVFLPIALISGILSLILRNWAEGLLILLAIITGLLGLANLADSNKAVKEKKGFKAMKYWSIRDWGKGALTGLLGGGVVAMTGGPFWIFIGGILMWIGIICGIVWIYKLVREKSRKQVQS